MKTSPLPEMLRRVDSQNLDLPTGLSECVGSYHPSFKPPVNASSLGPRGHFRQERMEQERELKVVRVYCDYNKVFNKELSCGLFMLILLEAATLNSKRDVFRLYFDQQYVVHTLFFDYNNSLGRVHSSALSASLVCRTPQLDSRFYYIRLILYP
jgi:hypothetical protein